MDIAQTGLQLQPFHTSGQPVTFVHYQAQQAAHNFLHKVLNSDRGIGVFYGPESSGKKTIVDHFVHSVPGDLSVAVVDGARLKPDALLTAILAQFADGSSCESIDDCWQAIGALLIRETEIDQAPLLVVENINKMYPSGLCALCKLAELGIQEKYALRMILMSNKAPFAVMHAPAMTAIAVRTVGAFALGPMTLQETSRYLYAKLLASGCDDPDSILPVDIRDDLHVASGGWPGRLDGAAMQAIEQAETRPVGRPPLAAVDDHDDDPAIQKLFLTLNRKTLQEIDLQDSKTLIGRSGLCDVSIHSRFVSKHHALLIRTDTAMHLVDLNSTNGTFVNSQRIKEKVLRHGDVISIGNHGIKLVCPAYRTRSSLEEFNLADTAKMKTIEDMRRVRSEPDVVIAPAEKTGTRSSD